MPCRQVAYTGTLLDAQIADNLPSNHGRSSLVYRLHDAYRLLESCEIISVKDATREDLLRFHEEAFVDILLRKKPSIDNDEDISDEEDEDDRALLEEFGLLYDCPVFPQMAQYVRTIAGSSLSAARYLTNTSKNTSKSHIIALNFLGGRHHAAKGHASGFCYINDIVLAIQHLRTHFTTVLYVDFDLHHGDAVESAFKYSENVVTFSIHRHDVGFFPGTGGLEDQGFGRGKGKAFNVPMRSGLSDSMLKRAVTEILMPVVESVNPDCVVVQCGCDGLDSDEHREWNLTIRGLGDAISQVFDLELPTLVLGGGGYNHLQAARFWTYLTSLAIVDTPHIKFDLMPDEVAEEMGYLFWDFDRRKMRDDNDERWFEQVKDVILGRLQ